MEYDVQVKNKEITWENVYIFISSTFNDMHAERDYLVKRVFPQVSAWCEERRLRLIDIDLRWGVSEADATQNKRVVQVCLNRIDECRPFFLCFLGQRRGWVPTDKEINDETKKRFPKLIKKTDETDGYLGNKSVTEMEIIHALIDPMHNGTFFGKDGKVKDGSRVEHAFFFLRDPSYLKQLTHADLKAVYTNEADPDPETADKELNNWREVIIPSTGRPVIDYTADLNVNENTYEIALPLVVPTTAPSDSDIWKEAFKSWKERWAKAKAKVTVSDNGEIADAKELKKAEEYNEQLTAGRLSNFLHRDERIEIDKIIIKQLQDAITKRFGERIAEQLTPLQKELDQQEQFLHIASEGFIKRGDDSEALNKYVNDEKETRPFALTAIAGIGKTSLLAHWIDKYEKNTDGETLHYRFIGSSDDSINIERLLRSLLSELKEKGKINSDIPVDTVEMIKKLPDLLEEAGKAGKTIVVIDALNQLETGMMDLYWIPSHLPDNVKLVVSFKRGDADAEKYYAEREASKDMVLHSVKPFDTVGDRVKLVSAYLEQYFKELDTPRIEKLVSSKGAENPLFLKAALSELRVFGVHNDLTSVILKRFGNTAASAFDAILKRMESDPTYTRLKPAVALPHIFGWLAHSRYGLSENELSGLLIREKLTDDRDESLDVIYLVVRQLRPFLAKRDGRIDFFYDSFRTAAKERYTHSHAYARTSKKWHQSLAEYFETIPLTDLHKLMEQAYQYAYAGMEQAYENYLFDYFYMESRLGNFGTNALMEDCSYLPLQNIVLLYDFHRLASFRLLQHPSQLAEELWGRMSGLGNKCFDKLLQQAVDVKAKRKEAWLRPKYACLDRPDGEIVRTYQSDGKIRGNIALSPDNKRMFSMLESGQLAVWDVDSGRILRTMLVKDAYPRRIIFAPDGTSFAVVCSDKIQIWNALNYEFQCDLQTKLHTSIIGHLALNSNCAYTNDSKTIIVRSSDFETKLLNSTNGELISSVVYIPDKNKGKVEGRMAVVGYLHDYKNNRRKVLTKDEKEEMKLLDASSNEFSSLAILTPEAYCYGIGGKTLVAMGCLHPDRDNKSWLQPWFKRQLCPVLLFDYNKETQQLIPRRYVLEGHDDSVRIIDVSPDDKLVATAQYGKIKLWDATTAALLGELSTDNMGIGLLKFLEDGKKLAVGGSDGILRIYNTPQLTCEKSIYAKIGHLSGTFFSDEAYCLLQSNEIVKLVSLKNHEATNGCCSDKLVSIGKHLNRNIIVASSYHNYIKQGSEPARTVPAKGNINFFATDGNKYLFSHSLLSIINSDMVYAGIHVDCIVSKDCMRGNNSIALFNYWQLEDIFDSDEEGIIADSFALSDFGSLFSGWAINNKKAHFSSDQQHLITLHRGTKAISIYKSKNGRLLNNINLNIPKSRRLLSFIFFKPQQSGRREKFSKFLIMDDIYNMAFDVTPDGTILYAINLKAKLCCCYNIPARKFIKFFSIENLKLKYHADELKVSLSEDGRKLLITDSFFISIIDLQKEKIYFQLARKGDYNCFASINKDGSLLCSSHKDTPNEYVEVWNTQQNDLIARFYVDGHATNILVEDHEFIFGMTNGEICTLILENYKINT
ncbi:hypothetical protein AGMMS50239_30400 [Bacteroidia bacterium]|nr:hypothetical protein AGMMS50239_30400 [Bacteroidia bacterium]